MRCDVPDYLEFPQNGLRIRWVVGSGAVFWVKNKSGIGIEVMLGFSSPKGDYSRRCNLRNSFTLVSFATLKGSNSPSIGLCSALSGLFSFSSLALIRRLHLRLLTFIPLRGCRKDAFS